jgi:replicative DNA helicase
MGKTALATNIAYNAAKHLYHDHIDNGSDKASVGFFSLEMSAEQLAARLIASAASVSSSAMKKGELGNDEFAQLVQASTEVANLPFFIDDTPALSISAVRTRARRLKRMHNLQLLVVDYLQLLRGSTAASQSNRVQEISEITQGLKAIAKELNIPVIALSQLSRAVEQREDKRPQLSDLRESGSIEQDADVVMFVFREEYYISRMMPNEDSPNFAEWQAKMERVFGTGEVIIAKQRHGPIGNVKLAFTSQFTRFGDLAKDEYMPEQRF